MDFLKVFLAMHSANSKASYENLCRKHLEPALKKCQVPGILAEQWLEEGLAPATVLKLLTLFGGWHQYTYGKPADLRGIKRMVRRRIGRKSDEPVWTKEEAEKALNVARHLDRYLYECLLFSLHTGARPGELHALEWRDVKFEAGVVLLRRSWSEEGVTKNGNGRPIPMTAKVREVLEARRTPGAKPDDIVFPERRFDRVWVKLIQIASIPPIAWKDLRATFATALLEGGTSLKKVSELLDHADPRTTARYYWRTRGDGGFDPSLLPE